MRFKLRTEDRRLHSTQPPYSRASVWLADVACILPISVGSCHLRSSVPHALALSGPGLPGTALPASG